MSKDIGLCFLQKLVEKFPDRSAEVEMGGKKFTVTVRSDFLVVYLGMNDGVVTDNRGMLVDYLADSSMILFGMMDEEIYELLVQKLMKAALEKGSTKQDIKVLIGSMAEYLPEEVELLLGLLMMVK